MEAERDALGARVEVLVKEVEVRCQIKPTVFTPSNARDEGYLQTFWAPTNMEEGSTPPSDATFEDID